MQGRKRAVSERDHRDEDDEYANVSAEDDQGTCAEKELAFGPCRPAAYPCWATPMSTTPTTRDNGEQQRPQKEHTTGEECAAIGVVGSEPHHELARHTRRNNPSLLPSVDDDRRQRLS
jgi:hypothetical protein